jgi:pantetheine-phosphate adenylyltransferase
MKTIAIYPGSFNPMHVGHLNILEKAERIFGRGIVITAIGFNPDKVITNEDVLEAAKEAEPKLTLLFSELAKVIA